MLPEETVDLASLAREVGEFLEPVAEEQGRTLTIAAAPGAFVRGSPRLLNRVIVNVLDNAFRHTRIGGRIDVEVKHCGARIRVSVRDEGPGFDEDPDRLLRRFARGTSTHAGAGLGLAICHEIVRAHHGRIGIASTTESGTTVSFEIPAAHP
jgi:signal transduction histidine kinase